MTHFILIDCPDPTYNSSTTDLDTSTRKQYYFSGENITYKCNSNHSLVSGNLTRTCLDNGSWSGKQPVCRSEKELCSKRLINMIFIYEKKSNKSARTPIPGVIQFTILVEPSLVIITKHLAVWIMPKSIGEDFVRNNAISLYVATSKQGTPAP